MDLSPCLRQVEDEMRDLLTAPDRVLEPYYAMMGYHLGWLDRDFGPSDGAGGKRFRPMVCFLSCWAESGRWEQAVPAAAALELVHNFSLIHDDIEDDSPLRRHRETVWYIWGIPQAINAGDGMEMIAHLALQRLLRRGIPAAQVLEVERILSETSLKLCHGQYLDLAFEERPDITVPEYLYMIGAKSAALISASAQIGALLGGADARILDAYSRFGWEMGLAFQMVDDILGIWGDPQVTGKSAASDILSRKKTLPVIYALSELSKGNADHAGSASRLRRIYSQDRVVEDDVKEVLKLLDEAGARQYVQGEAQAHTGRALAALLETGPEIDARKELADTARSFLERTS